MKCPNCNGDGVLQVHSCRGDAELCRRRCPDIAPCEVCGGTGEIAAPPEPTYTLEQVKSWLESESDTTFGKVKHSVAFIYHPVYGLAAHAKNGVGG